MKKPVPMLALMLLALAGPGGCRGTKSVAEAVKDPPAFRLLLGKGGGFTGQWQGFVVHADGGVWTWRGLGVPEESLRVATLDARSLDSLRLEVERSGLLEASTSGAGNLSARLEITHGDRSRTLTWASGLFTDAPDLPEERFYARAERFLAARVGGRP